MIVLFFKGVPQQPQLNNVKLTWWPVQWTLIILLGGNFILFFWLVMVSGCGGFGHTLKTCADPRGDQSRYCYGTWFCFRSWSVSFFSCCCLGFGTLVFNLKSGLIFVVVVVFGVVVFFCCCCCCCCCCWE